MLWMGKRGVEKILALYLLAIFQCFGAMAMLYASISQNYLYSLLNFTIAKTLDENESKNYFPQPHQIQSLHNCGRNCSMKRGRYNLKGIHLRHPGLKGH